MNLHELRNEVVKIQESPTDWKQVAAFMAEALDKFDQNKVKWAIEDEEEREEWQELLVLSAVAAFYKA